MYGIEPNAYILDELKAKIKGNDKLAPIYILLQLALEDDAACLRTA